ncbi:hypothetical protein TNCV_4074791 [Trichonephila clavipes]|nr:hypothetical protein TNCV_4074791 [Trichonephila clavipes]
MMAGIVLADVGSSSQLRSVVSLWFLLMALDVWKEVSGVESASDVVGAEVATLLIAFLAIICVPGTPDGTLTFCDPLLPTPSNYHIAKLSTCFSKAYYTGSVSCSYCRRFLSRHPKSQYRKSSDSFDSRGARTHAFKLSQLRN